MDLLNQALYLAFKNDASYMAAAPGGMWNQRADSGTPLPLGKFQMFHGEPSYSFNNVSCERYLYRVTACAEETETASGASLAAIVNGHIKRVVNAASLSVTGYEVLTCWWTGLIAPDCKPGASGRDEYSEGVIVEIIITHT
jgi:hypothetical protein